MKESIVRRPELREVTRGELTLRFCRNCGEGVKVYENAAARLQWCPKCKAEIKRLRARKRYRRLHPGKKKRGRSMVPVVRLTEKTIKELGLE